MTILIVNFDDQNGLTLPDGKIQNFVHETLQKFEGMNQNLVITIGSESIIHEFRCAVKRKELSHNDIKFCYSYNGNNFEVFVDRDGRLECNWDPGFCYLMDRQLEELVS